MTSVRSDLRLARQLTRGSDRGEWWRVSLTAAGSALATAFALAAVILASLRGFHALPFGGGLLNGPGQRSGAIVVLLLLLVPVLGFLGQCARIGAVHRDRRLAALRLAGATPAQVRRIAALESGPACLFGSALVSVAAVACVLGLWDHPSGLTWAGIAAVALGVPVLGTAVGVPALRRVVAEPLGSVRRVRPESGRGPGLLFAGAVLLVAVVAAGAVTGTSAGHGSTRGYVRAPLLAVGLLSAAGAGGVLLAGASAGLAGRLLSRRARTAVTLIAAERLRDDPWAAARTHAAVLLVTVSATAFVGVRRTLLADLHGMDRAGRLGGHMSFYTTGLNLTGAAILLALAIALSGLAVGTAESLAGRRRGLAAQSAAGVPHGVLARALLLETALPLAPAVLVAGAGGMTVGAWYASIATEYTDPAVPYAALLVPVVVYAACLAAAATSLPLLRRAVRPGELRQG
ncbi:FtsX-like permease family protein [Streptomyces sp. NPDC005574]|uniref:FtsX-like permease family protein n=1 Tax=Streptomyces sp. NPDC005574 TaxID=3156891 RepID=UPI0033B8B078